MKQSKLLSALILIVSALLLSAASGGSGNEKHQNQTKAHDNEAGGKPHEPALSFTIVVQPAPVQITQASPAIEQNKPKQKWYERPTVTDWGVLLVTLAYVGVSIGLLKATQQQAWLANASLVETRKAADAATASTEIAKSTMILAHRAALGIKGINFTLSTSSKMIVFVENFGRIAASKIRIQVKSFRNTAEPQAVDWSTMMPPSENRVTEGEMMPGVPYPIPITTAFLPDDQIQAIKRKMVFIYLSGRIVYDDGFGTDRTLLLRFAYDVDSGNFLSIFV